jgi:hypothetical protein
MAMHPFSLFNHFTACLKVARAICKTNTVTTFLQNHMSNTCLLLTSTFNLYIFSMLYELSFSRLYYNFKFLSIVMSNPER